MRTPESDVSRSSRANIEAAIASRNFEDAAKILQPLLAQDPENFSYLYLAGRVTRELGHYEAALQMMDKAIRVNRSIPDVHISRGHLLRLLKRPAEALSAYREASMLASENTQALIGEVHALCDLGQFDEAAECIERLAKLGVTGVPQKLLQAKVALKRGNYSKVLEHYDRVLAVQPDNPEALAGRAKVALERGEARASERYAHARKIKDAPHLVIGHAEALEASDPQSSIALLQEHLRQQPTWIDGHRTLARIRREQGDPAFDRDFRQIALAGIASPTFVLAYAETMFGCQKPDTSAEILSRVRKQLGNKPQYVLLEATYNFEAGRPEQARELLRLVPSGFHGALQLIARLAIRDNDPERADAALSQALEEQPRHMELWALRHTAWRMMEDKRLPWLERDGALVSFRPLDLSHDQMTRIAEWATNLHATRAAPIGQSVRNGTQTRGRLFSRADKEAVVLHDHLLSILQDVWHTLPASDGKHPLLKHRDKAPFLAGSWSVRLTGDQGGFHSPHVHSQGLLSSACYLTVPENGEETGFLEIGKPPPALHTDLGALHVLRPEAGMLALFPSFYWHGTRPFPKGERVTAAFDVLAR